MYNSHRFYMDKSEYRKALELYIREKYVNLDGFVLFDQANRYQIDFPSGWTKEEAEPEEKSEQEEVSNGG